MPCNQPNQGGWLTVIRQYVCYKETSLTQERGLSATFVWSMLKIWFVKFL